MAKAKITDEQAAEMYRKYTEEGATYKKLAEEYKVSLPTVIHAVSEYEKKHRWDPNTAPLACDQQPPKAVPQSVITAVEDSIAAIEMQIADAVAKIKEQQREVDAMKAHAAELRKWKEAQA